MEGGGKAEAEQKAKAARKRLEGILAAKQREGSEEGDEDDEHPWGKDRPKIADLQLSSYEQTIAMEVVAPEDIAVKFDGMCCHFEGGYEEILLMYHGERLHLLTRDRHRRSRYHH